MAILLDAGVLYAYYDRSDRWHESAVAVISEESDGLVVPAPVIPEVDHFLGRRLGREAQARFYEGLTDGSYFPVALTDPGYRRVLELHRQFADLDLGFVDAAVAAIAETLDLRRLATVDRRHFAPLSAVLGLELRP